MKNPYRLIDTKRHLCELCNRRLEFPQCLPGDVEFGDGKGGDNIIRCENFSPLEIIKDVQSELFAHARMEKEEKVATAIVDEMFKAGCSYADMQRIIRMAEVKYRQMINELEDEYRE